MRFRLKTHFMDYAREQIRGGVWYKPAWWDAVSRVPPVHFQPRIPKASVPKLTFMEDGLLRQFEARNPAIAAFDRPGPTGERGAPHKTVAAQFVEQQLAAMREGRTQGEAYDVARAWLLDNGPRLYSQLAVPPEVEATLAQTPASIALARQQADEALTAQLEEVRGALAEVALVRRQGQVQGAGSDSEDEGGEGAPTGGAGAGSRVHPALAAYRSYRSAGEDEATAKRAWSREPQLPRGGLYESDDEAEAPDSAAAGAAAAEAAKPVTDEEAADMVVRGAGAAAAAAPADGGKGKRGAKA